MAVDYNPAIVTDGLLLCVDAANPKSYSGTGTTWFDVSGNGYDLTIYGSPTFNSSGYFTFANNQTTQYMMRSSFANPTSAVTYSCWFRTTFLQDIQTPFTYSVAGNNEMLFYITNNTTLTPHPLGVATNVTTSSMTNVWVNFAWSRLSSTGENFFYRDGTQVGQYTGNAGTNITTGGYLIIGQESDSAGGGFDPNQNLDGDFARIDVYSRVLSAAEIKENFNAIKGRFAL